VKRASETDRLLVKSSVVRLLDPLISREDAIRVAAAGRVAETGRSDKPVLAYINDSRWVANCECGGGELVSEGQEMLCGSCGVVSPVKFPTKKKVEQLERLLEVRPVRSRNWNLEETVDELLAQNIEHGIGDI
jgi:hypothetical protein